MEFQCFGVILDETINEFSALKPVTTLKEPQKRHSQSAGDHQHLSKNEVATLEEESLLLPSHERLVNYRRYISDHLNSTDVSKLDHTIHKQASRYKIRCRMYLDEIEDHCNKHQVKMPGTVEADCLKMACELYSVLQMLVEAANELKKGNVEHLKSVVDKEEKKQREFKDRLDRYYATQQMLSSVEQELVYSQQTKEENLKQQELIISALDWFIGEQVMNLEKERSYVNRSADAAIARLDKFWQNKLTDIRKEICILHESTVNEELCRTKTLNYLIETLHKVNIQKNDSLIDCDTEFKKMCESVEELRTKIKEVKKSLRNFEEERGMMEQFHSVFDSEIAKAKKDAQYRRRSKWAALKIQKVWRGVMVRKGLGQFKYLKKKRRQRKSKPKAKSKSLTAWKKK